MAGETKHCTFKPLNWPSLGVNDDISARLN